MWPSVFARHPMIQKVPDFEFPPLWQRADIHEADKFMWRPRGSRLVAIHVPKTYYRDNSKTRPQCRPAFSIVVVLCKIICLELYRPYCPAPPSQFYWFSANVRSQWNLNRYLVSRLAETFIFQINISKYFSLRSLPASTLGNLLLVWWVIINTYWTLSRALWQPVPATAISQS